MIVNRFVNGETILQLSNHYFLSQETIKKIVYQKKNIESMVFAPSILSAKEYEDAGLLEEWLHTYLLFIRKNKDFSDGLYKTQRFFIGPILMPLSLFSRNSGPEPDMKWVVHPIVFEKRVNEWIEKIIKEEQLPPLIINYENNQFEVNCNSPLLEALKQLEIIEHSIIIWNTKQSDYESFRSQYAHYIC